MAIDTQLITKLRQQTGAGISDVKNALEEANGDTEKAIELLRKKGAIKAAKKGAEREASEGLVGSYIHSNGKIGVLVAVNCETDFVARNDDFKEMVRDIAMHIAAANPSYLKPEEVPAEELEKEKDVYREQLKGEGKPEDMIEKILGGKIDKYYTEVCLLKQPFVKDDKISIEQLIEQSVLKLGEKIEITKFVRYEI